MRMSATPRASQLAALSIFSTALVTLVVNDWLLKGQGIVPTWLSGKLSDFAGLIVAPVTLVLVAAVRRQAAQLVCVVVVASVFALTEISPACAEMAERLAAQVGLPWRLWPDLGDLAALGVLPITWFCCRVLSSTSHARGPGAHSTRWLTLPACIACLASGTNTFSANAYVYNASGATAFVEVSRTWLNCADLSGFDGDFLQPEDFVSLGLYQLEKGAVLPLDMDDYSRAGELRDCDCALLRVSVSGRTLNVRLQDLPAVDLVRKPSVKEVLRHREQLIILPPEPEPIAVGAMLGTFDLGDPGAQAYERSCPPEDVPSLDFALPSVLRTWNTVSGSPLSLRDVEIVALEPVAGNCFEIELDATPESAARMTGSAGATNAGGLVETQGDVDGGADASPLDAIIDAGADADNPQQPQPRGNARVHVCAPLDMFPFQVGDRVDWASEGLTYQEPSGERLDIQNGQAGFRLTRGPFFTPQQTWQQYPEWEGYTATLPALRCGPLRDVEGALFELIDVAYAGQVLVPGQAVQIEGTSREIQLGRAERHLARACGTQGSWVEVVERWTK